jgi:hypothetical protein
VKQPPQQVLRRPYRHAELARVFRAALAGRSRATTQATELTVGAKQ